jgi:hypothetical protein
VRIQDSDLIEKQPIAAEKQGASVVSGFQTLDGFVHQPGCSDGVAFQSLELGTVVTVRTKHSCYRLVVLDGPQRRALVSGGALFPERTEVRIDGATAGGSAIKTGWIGVGLRLEMSRDSQRITTSVVQSLTVNPAQSQPIC